MDLEQYRQVISDAIKNEIEAKEFYEKVAEKIKDKYLGELFGKFALEEAKHEKILSGILNKEKMDTTFLILIKIFMWQKQ